MGASESTPLPDADENNDPNANIHLKEYAGYHVLKVKNDSPAYKAGLEPFFDYIVTAANIRLVSSNEGIRSYNMNPGGDVTATADVGHEDVEDSRLIDIVKSNIDKAITLKIYSSKSRKLRDVSLTPNTTWGNGNGGSLGCAARFCNFRNASEMVFHVLEVMPSSPASTAGLQSNLDYIIGTPTAIVHDESEFLRLVEGYLDRSLQLYVYNYKLDETREVTIVPSVGWGGEGSLGCTTGFGLIHRIPNIPYSESEGALQPGLDEKQEKTTKQTEMKSETGTGTETNGSGNDSKSTLE